MNLSDGPETKQTLTVGRERKRQCLATRYCLREATVPPNICQLGDWLARTSWAGVKTTAAPHAGLIQRKRIAYLRIAAHLIKMSRSWVGCWAESRELAHPKGATSRVVFVTK
jgi:hypothetical protein